MKTKSKKRADWITEISADRDEWIELLGVTPCDATLQKVGISRRTWRAIFSGLSPRVPIAAYHLAEFHRYGSLESLAGASWRDFFVCGNALAFPGLKYPLGAPDLRALWLRLQDTARLRSEVKLLRRDLARLDPDYYALPDVKMPALGGHLVTCDA